MRPDADSAASSYDDDALDVYGRRRPLVHDTRLREIVAPWARHPLKSAVARVARRSY